MHRVQVQIVRNSGRHRWDDAQQSLWSEEQPVAMPKKRWVVERSFAWLEKNRRLWKNCERLLNTSLQFVHLAFLALLLKRS